MTKITIDFEDISPEKQLEVYNALEKEGLDINSLNDTHEFYIECTIDEDEITFE